jgi:hypothetical protein
MGGRGGRTSLPTILSSGGNDREEALLGIEDRTPARVVRDPLLARI